MQAPRNDEDLKMTVRDYSGNVLRFAFAYLKSRADAEDIAQEVFLAYMLKKPCFDAEQKKKAWLMRVTANKCKNHLKAMRRHAMEPLPENLGKMPDADADLMDSVLNLDEKYRVPIHLHYYEGYSINEIAQVMGAKPPTVGTWLARGRSLLKSMIGDDSK